MKITGKKKFIIILAALITFLVSYGLLFSEKISYTIEADERTTTDEYSVVAFDATIIKLPLNYLLAYGSVAIDGQEMVLGSYYNGKIQFVNNNDRFTTMRYFNPKYYTEDYQLTKHNISGGMISLVKDLDKKFDYYYAHVFIKRTKLNTTMTQSFTLSGKLR